MRRDPMTRSRYAQMSTTDLARRLNSILNRNRKDTEMSDVNGNKQVTPRFKKSTLPAKKASKKIPAKVTKAAKKAAKTPKASKAPRAKAKGSNILKVLDAIEHQKGEFKLTDIADSTGLTVKQVSGYVSENATKVKKGLYKKTH